MLMARERIISSGSEGPEEERTNHALRPQLLDEVVGQKQVIEQLRIALEAAKGRGEAMEHVLLDGPPGLGKTTLAHVIANEMGTNVRVTSGPAIGKQSDLMTVLTNLEPGEILFIDEIHRLAAAVEEFLYPAMEDFRVDYTLEGGLGGRTINFKLSKFTMIGATTRAGLLTAALRDRFGIHFHLDFYKPDELKTILRRSAKMLDVPADEDALQLMADRSRGTPRVANRLLRRARDYAQVRSNGHLTAKAVELALGILQVDELGLDDLDRAYLRTLIEIYECGPVGVEAVAAAMGQERDTLEDVVEPYLLQIGFVLRTRQGRCASRAACKHMKLPYKAPRAGPEDAPTLFEQ
jgi:Holliday junction DNA helicase RuvB